MTLVSFTLFCHDSVTEAVSSSAIRNLTRDVKMETSVGSVLETCIMNFTSKTTKFLYVYTLSFWP